MNNRANLIELQQSVNPGKSNSLPSRDVRAEDAKQNETPCDRFPDQDQQTSLALVPSDGIESDVPKLVRSEVQTFDQYSPTWLAAIKPQVAPRTYFDYTRYVANLSQYFGPMQMDAIELEHLEEYQQIRLENQVEDPETGKTVKGKMKSGVSVNRELGLVMRQMLKKLKRWETVGKHYREIHIREESPGRAATDEEEQKLYAVCYDAAQNVPNLRVAACATLISMNTTFGPGELRAMQLKHVNLERNPPTLTVPPKGAKRQSRERTITLNEHALFATTILLDRAKKECGCYSSEHYLIPARPYRNHYDPTKPIGDWKYAYRELLAIADVKKLRKYDLRHHATTQLLQNPDVSEEQVKQIAGWVSNDMLKKYSHVRLDNIRSATDALAKRMRPVLASLMRRKSQGTVQNVNNVASNNLTGSTGGYRVGANAKKSRTAVSQ